MRRASTLLLGALACAPANKGTQPAAIEPPTAPRPAWVDTPRFLPATGELAVVATCPIDQDPCANAERLMTRCRAQSLQELVRALGRERPEAEGGMAGGSVQGAESVAAWFDAARLHVLATAPVPADSEVSDLGPGSAEGGTPLPTATGQLASMLRARLAASGACEDPHRRSGLTCCGPVETFCSDPGRFDRPDGAGRCACGESAPCLFDFVCEKRRDPARCVCRGKSCPCAELNCRDGQQCGDGRCY